MRRQLKYPNKRSIAYIDALPNSYRFRGDILNSSKRSILLSSDDLDKLDVKIKKQIRSLDDYAKIFGLELKNLNELQQSELGKVFERHKLREIFNKNIIKILIARSVSRVVERARFLNNLKCNQSLPYLIILYGLTDGIMKYKKNKFISNNPGKDHRGKLSPFSKKFVKYEKLNEEEKNQKIQAVLDKAKETAKKHPEKQRTHIEFYINKYGDNGTARVKFYEFCNTRSLESFKKRYGDEEGQLKFNEVVEKWQNTLKNKPTEEIIEINRKKASCINSSFKPRGKNYNTNGKCYYIKFFKDGLIFYKIGITKKKITERFWANNLGGKIKYEIIDIFEDKIYNCFLKEQNILKKFSSNRINVEIDGKLFTTEAFDYDVLGGNKIENY